jgi:hypothetical protein
MMPLVRGVALLDIATIHSGFSEQADMAQRECYSRSYHRFAVAFPVVFGGAPFVGEGSLTDLSLTGCSITCDRTVLVGSHIRLNVLLTDPRTSLLVELGKVRWVHAHCFGVEFIRLPTIARQRLDRIVWERLARQLESWATTGPLSK